MLVFWSCNWYMFVMLHVFTLCIPSSVNSYETLYIMLICKITSHLVTSRVHWCLWQSWQWKRATSGSPIEHGGSNQLKSLRYQEGRRPTNSRTHDIRLFAWIFCLPNGDIRWLHAKLWGFHLPSVFCRYGSQSPPIATANSPYECVKRTACTWIPLEWITCGVLHGCY